MVSKIKPNFLAKVVLLVASAVMVYVLVVSCFPSAASTVGQAYSAKMVTTIHGRTSVADIFVQNEKMHMLSRGGRVFSTMIVRYDKDLLWLMAPVPRQYHEMALSAMRDNVPHFFHPDTKVIKEKVGEEILSDQKAIKYKALIEMKSREKKYTGFLWESTMIPGFPLRWEEPDAGITVEWQEAQWVEQEESLFDIPPGYRLVKLPTQAANPERHQGLHAAQKRAQ